MTNQAQQLGVEANKKLERQGNQIYDFEKKQQNVYYEIKKGDKRAKRVNRSMFYTILYEPLTGLVQKMLCCLNIKTNQSTEKRQEKKERSHQRESIRLSKYQTRKTTTEPPERRSTRTRTMDAAKGGLNTMKNIANGSYTNIVPRAL